MSQKPAIIVFCTCDAVGSGRLSVGYCGQHKGRVWCFPDEEMVKATNGFEIYDQTLQQLEGLNGARDVYLLQPAQNGMQRTIGEPRRPRRRP